MTNGVLKILEFERESGDFICEAKGAAGSFDVFKVDSDCKYSVDDTFDEEFTCLVAANPFTSELNALNGDVVKLR